MLIISAFVFGVLYAPTQASTACLVGYAKDNPIGETKGGAGGSTTTVTSEDALRTAVAVKLCLSCAGGLSLTKILKYRELIDRRYMLRETLLFLAA